MKKFLGLFLIYLIFSASCQAKDLRFVQVTDTRFSKNSENQLEMAPSDHKLHERLL